MSTTFPGRGVSIRLWVTGSERVVDELLIMLDTFFEIFKEESPLVIDMVKLID
jgi:hypothetical protein